MNRKCVLFALGFIMVVFMLMVIQESAQAIPPFARKYETSCSTCHVAIPKRNAFGEAFRKNGYEIPGGDADYIKQKQVELGSPEWKEVWPNGLWPGAIPPSFPLGAYIHQRATLDVKKKDDGGTDLSPNLEMPHEFEIFVGGTLGEGIGFFGEWVAFEKMKDAEGLKSMYIQFNEPFGPDNLLNIKFGRFEPGTTRGHPDNDRMTMEHILPWEYRVSKVGSQWRMRDKQAGIELNGVVSKRIDFAVGVVNGDGTTLDKNKMKDLYGRIGYKLGGMPLDGEEEIPETLATTNNWQDDTLMVGVYGYVGDSVLPGKDKAGKDITY